MYVVMVPIQIKEGYRERYLEELTRNARGAVEAEPGCLRFDVIQDANDPNRIWVDEVYKDEAAFQEHTRSPHFLKCIEAVKDWRDEATVVGAGVGASVIWPPDDRWK